MTLTPEDVLNKNFTPTQFRRGYDEREVDDFLDEVVAEMRRIVKESDDLRDQLNECRQSKGMPAVAKPDHEAEAKRAADAKAAQEAEAKAGQERIAAHSSRRRMRPRRPPQERIAAARTPRRKRPRRPRRSALPPRTPRRRQAEKAAQERIAAAPGSC